MAPRTSANGTQEAANTHEADMEPQTTDKQNSYVFIADDSTTTILSQNKMTDANLQVKIKSPQDGRLQFWFLGGSRSGAWLGFVIPVTYKIRK